MKLPTFIYKSRHGIYYVRYVVSQKLRRQFDDIRKEIRVSLNTSKKREALSRGCALYAELSNLFFEDDHMTKLLWEGKLTEASEILVRSKARAEAAQKLKRDRANVKKEQIFNEELEKQLTDEDRKNGISASNRETEIIELNEAGKYQTLEVIKEYLAEQEKNSDWIKKTKDTKRRILSLFAAIIGGRCFDKIHKEHLIAYKKFISKLPCGYSTDKRFKKMSLDELVATEHDKVLSRETIGKHIGTVRSLFDWAVHERSYTDENYAKDLTQKGSRKTKSKKVKREIFTKDELQKIFSGSEYMRRGGVGHKYDAFFWCPLMGLYTGARLDEICRLRTVDIGEDNGIHYIAFNSQEGEGKTEAAKRNSPIPRMLIDIGFLNFVQRQRENKHERLFPELKFHQSNGYSAQVSKWFNGKYLVQIGVKDLATDKNTKVFYSFRHTLINHLQEKGVNRDRIRVFEGHQIPDEYSYYQHGLGLKTIADEVVAKIDFELDFSHFLNPKINQWVVVTMKR